MIRASMIPAGGAEDIGNRPSNDLSAEIEEMAREEQKRKKSSKSQHPKLEKLVPNNQRLKTALEHYLLADTERQMIQFGGVETLEKDAQDARQNGNRKKARVNYEYAAKIEIYRRNRESASNFLVLAEQVTDPEDSEREFHKILLANMDQVMRISEEEYKGRANF